jgi:hypothetical protein
VYFENNPANQIIPFSYESRNKNSYDEILLLFYPEFSKNNDFNKLANYFQPLDEPPELDDDDILKNGEVIIVGPKTAAFYLVKSKHNLLYTENYEIFKQTINEFCPKNAA